MRRLDLYVWTKVNGKDIKSVVGTWKLYIQSLYDGAMRSLMLGRSTEIAQYQLLTLARKVPI